MIGATAALCRLEMVGNARVTQEPFGPGDDPLLRLHMGFNQPERRRRLAHAAANKPESR